MHRHYFPQRLHFLNFIFIKFIIVQGCHLLFFAIYFSFCFVVFNGIIHVLFSKIPNSKTQTVVSHILKLCMAINFKWDWQDQRGQNMCYCTSSGCKPVLKIISCIIDSIVAYCFVSCECKLIRNNKKCLRFRRPLLKLI